MTRRFLLSLSMGWIGILGGCIRLRPRAKTAKKPCSSCKGTGKFECFACQGKGKVHEFGPDLKIEGMKDCPSCNGNGSHKCFMCGGTGKM